MTEFMTLVERAVRPVPASPMRKQRMREELLAHLTGVYQAELPRLGEAAALDAAVRRFGDPAELTEGLTASLSARDRFAGRVDRWFGWQPGEPPYRWAVRLAGLTALLVVTMSALGLAAAEVRRPADPSVPTAATFLRIVAAMLGLGCGVTFLWAWLGIALREALAAGRRGRAAGCLAGLAVALPALTAAVYGIAVPEALAGPVSVPPGSYQLLALALSVIVLPVAAVAYARSTSAVASRRLEWARLDLGR
jgi:hypothetical protein